MWSDGAGAVSISFILHFNTSNTKANVLFYPMFSDFRTTIVFWNVSRLRPFTLPVRAICTQRLVWRAGGVILTKENWSTRTETCPSATLTKDRPGTKPVLLCERPAGDKPPELRHGHLKTKTNLNYSPRPYRAVNTLHLGLKNESVNALWDLIPVCSAIHIKHIKALPAEIKMLNLVLQSDQWTLKNQLQAN